ncbi:MAG: type II toxin-antitoxin system HicB family antitoxin [Candidatus Diapherotrites archaeon]|nr:type II toxin-antitoxin system HicB family antitoxin [Candidatus Diapherotrites archaeon]
MKQDFDVVLEQDKKTKQFYASVPALPGCYSYADDLEGLMKNIAEAIELHLEVLHGKKRVLAPNPVLGMVKVTV